MIANQHTNNYRLAATVISVTNLAKWATPGDPLYKLLEALIKTGDPYVIQVMIKELGTVFPPTSATGSLLLIAQPFLNPMDKVAILRDKLKNQGTLRDLKDTMLDINTLMGDASGAAPNELVDQLVIAGSSPERANIIASAIQFEGLQGKRLDLALSRVIELAPTEPICARILDQKLLGSPTPALVLRTLELLSTAESPEKRLSEIFNDQILDLAFGPSKNASAVAGAQRINMTENILIDSPNHSAFRLMTNPDSKIRELTWKSLIHFRIVDVPDLNPDLYRVVIDIALAQNPVPPQVIEFLSRQPNTNRVADSFFRIILFGKDNNATTLACKALRSSKGALPLDKAINRLSYGDRHGVGVRVYECLTGDKAPLVVGLLRQRTDNLPIAAWFGTELSNDRLPKPEAWGAQLNDEDRLLELSQASDNELALAACSALMFSTGSDDKLVAPVLARFRNIEEPTSDKIKEEWKLAKQEIYANRIQRAAGPMRIRLEVLKPGVAVGSPANAPGNKQPQGNPDIYELGSIDFIANAEGLKLANNALTMIYATNTLGIRVEKPAELKTMSPDLLAKVPLEKVDQGTILAPKPDGSWRGLIALPENKTAELSFIPVTPQQ